VKLIEEAEYASHQNIELLMGEVILITCLIPPLLYLMATQKDGKGKIILIAMVVVLIAIQLFLMVKIAVGK